HSASDTYTLSLHDALPIWGQLRSMVIYEPHLPINTSIGVEGPAQKAVAAACFRVCSTNQICSSPHSSLVYAVRPPLFSCVVAPRSEEHTSELQSRFDLVCR